MPARNASIRGLLAGVLGSSLLSCGGLDPASTPPSGSSAAPWSDRPVLTDSTALRFAVVGDRAGGTRLGVFESALPLLNLMRPDFVLSVGDLTTDLPYEGTDVPDAEVLERRFRDFEALVNRLDMRFFYVPGNADAVHYTEDGASSDPRVLDQWMSRYGSAYYAFRQGGSLFLVLNSDDPPGPGEGAIGADQITWLGETLAANQDVVWTFMFLHRPVWMTSPETWQPVEDLLAARPRTVFAGHHHVFRTYRMGPHTYYGMATTGGASPLTGPEEGYLDHIAWVTLTADGPVVANLALDGIMGTDIGEHWTPPAGG